MSEREKLIKLIDFMTHNTYSRLVVESMVDYLIENGVKLPVTCGECVHSAEQDDGTVFCVKWINYSQKNGWCWLGERREDNG